MFHWLLQHMFPALGHSAVGRLIGCLQGHVHVDVRFEKQGHADQRAADRRRLDPGPLDRAGRVGGQGQWFACGQLKRVVADLMPDRSVDALRIARVGGNRSTMSR